MEEMLKLFENPVFGKIRTTEIDGKIYFVGSDIAQALGYLNPRKAIADHCRGVTKRDIPTSSGIQAMSVIPEGDIYRLVVRSKLPYAEKFEAWIFEEVLPSIREKKGYIASTSTDTPEEIMARAILIANDTIKRQKEQLEKQAPKVLFATAVETSQRSCLIAELAKIISQNGVEIGQNRLFQWMRDHGYLCYKGEYYNQPTQRAMEAGLFELKKTSITKPDGSILVTTTTKVSGHGQIYFVNKFLNSK